MKKQSKTQLLEAFNTFLQFANLQQIPDPRKPRGIRYDMSHLLRILLTSIACGSRSLTSAQRTYSQASRAVRKALLLPHTVSTSALRYLLVKLSPHDLSRAYIRMARLLLQNNHFPNNDFPYGVLAVDGKMTLARLHDKQITQRRGSKAYLRTLTACLVSNKQKPCIATLLEPPTGNEASHFPQAFRRLLQQFGNHFQILSYDAAICKQPYAQQIHEAGKGYVIALKKNQLTLWQQAHMLLECAGPASCDAHSVELSGTHIVTRRVWALRVSGYPWWKHTCTLIRIHKKCEDKVTGCLQQEERYFISNIPVSPNRTVSCGDNISGRGLCAKQWLKLIRLHWGVENNVHGFLDKQLREDDHPWLYEARGLANMVYLRRMIALFWSVYRQQMCASKRPCGSWPDTAHRMLYLVWTCRVLLGKVGSLILDSS